MMNKWLLMLTTCALVFAGAAAVQAQDGEATTVPVQTTGTFLCESANEQTGGAITVTGSFDNVFDAERNLTGSSYCHVIVRDSQVLTSLAEVGNQEAIGRGIIHAVDVVGMFPEGETWNEFRTPVRVCLRGEGDVLYLRAEDLGRTLTRLTQVEGQEGYSCADVNNTGIVMLTPPGPPLPTEGIELGPEATPPPVPPADPASVIELTNCQVITKVNGLFLRREPDTRSRIRWQFQGNQTLNATGIAGDWYRIDFRGRPGWLAAAFVTPIGDCRLPDGSVDVQAAADPFAPGDPETYYGLTDCQITTNFNGVNLRREPRINASIRWTFEDSQTLDAVGVSGNWFLIAFRGSPGWIHAHYVNAVGECAQPEPTEE